MSVFDQMPSLNPKQMWQMMKLVKKLPKEQLAKMQSLATAAMAGKDVSREMAAIMAKLPPDVQEAFMKMAGETTEKTAEKTTAATQSGTGVRGQTPNPGPSGEHANESSTRGITRLWKKVTGKSP